MSKITESTDFDIRYTQTDDTPYLRSWLDVPGMLHWFPMSTQAEVDQAIAVWIGFSRINASLTATYKGEPCGMGTLFLMPYRKVAHHCLFKMIVSPEHQRQGVGTALLRNLKHHAKNYFRLELMHIEIFESNPIEFLLLKNGFRQFARQQRYVKEENGQYLTRVLMETDL